MPKAKKYIDVDGPLSVRLASFALICKACGWPDKTVHMLGISALELQRLEEMDEIMNKLQGVDTAVTEPEN